MKRNTRKIFKSTLTATILFVLLSVTVTEAAQVNNFRLKFPKGKSSAAQTRNIKAGGMHDIFFRARKGQRVNIKITSTDGVAQFNLGAMNKFDVDPIQDNTQSYTGKLPFAGIGEYVIRVESEQATRYTLSVSIQ